MVINSIITLKTNGNCDIINITERVQSIINSEKINNGIITLFVPGSTGAITTIEYESGLIKDFNELMDKIIPANKNYLHNQKWQDGNGHSHLCASLIGPSLCVPVNNNKLLLGTWQQIVFIDFDIHPRNRKLILQIVGE